MTKPIVAIIGRQNTGKSTLLNRLAGKPLAIVADVPGTTRDRIFAPVTWRDTEFNLVDTGGLEPVTDSPITRGINAQIEAAIEVVDVASGQHRRLATRRKESDTRDGPTTLRWQFDAEALAWGDAVLRAATPCDLLVVDEVGPLEFERGEGWMGGLAAVDSMAFATAFVVVRPGFLDRALDRWPGTRVTEIDNATAAEAAARRCVESQIGHRLLGRASKRQAGEQRLRYSGGDARAARAAHGSTTAPSRTAMVGVMLDTGRAPPSGLLGRRVAAKRVSMRRVEKSSSSSFRTKPPRVTSCAPNMLFTVLVMQTTFPAASMASSASS